MMIYCVKEPNAYMGFFHTLEFDLMNMLVDEPFKLKTIILIKFKFGMNVKVFAGPNMKHKSFGSPKPQFCMGQIGFGRKTLYIISKIL